MILILLQASLQHFYYVHTVGEPQVEIKLKSNDKEYCSQKASIESYLIPLKEQT